MIRFTQVKDAFILALSLAKQGKAVKLERNQGIWLVQEK